MPGTTAWRPRVREHCSTRRTPMPPLQQMASLMSPPPSRGAGRRSTPCCPPPAPGRRLSRRARRHRPGRPAGRGRPLRALAGDAPGYLELTWGATSRFRLTVQTAGPDVAGALDQLLAQWHTHLAAVPEAGADDTAAVVTWPSRDVDGPLALLRHGLAARAAIAARPAGRRAAGRPVHGRDRRGWAAFPAPGRGVQIRRPGPLTSTLWSAWAWRRSGSTRISAP